MFKVVEIKNPLAIHALCDTLERAQYWIDVKSKEYARLGYFMDKTLNPNSFMIISGE